MRVPVLEKYRHPLAPLTEAEFHRARDILIASHDNPSVLYFRTIQLEEPKKVDLIPYLVAEHAGQLSDETPRPPRLARILYDVVKKESQKTFFQYTQSVVDLASGHEVSREEAPVGSNPAFTVSEFAAFHDACVKSTLFQEAMSEFVLPRSFSVVIDPWPYGGPDDADPSDRWMQGLVFARDTSSGNPDANHYAYPIPIIPVMDWVTKEVIRVDRLATSVEPGTIFQPPRGKNDPPIKLFEASKGSEYVPELLDKPLRKDMKPINITQPQGASFTVHEDNLVEWQKWRFRLGFTPREGAVLHDLCYDGRSVLYRLSYSEMAVPYSDPRYPFHRKQAFDLGDGGVGRAANNLELGCDCLGAIHYFDALLVGQPDGSPELSKSVVCLHEQDNGIGWKHTNFRTSRAVVARLRELVVQFIATLANYEYIFIFKLDVTGNITIETRATGVISVVGVDPDTKTTPYGAIVAPGVLGQNHQHVFATRIDPAIDSYAQNDTVIIQEDTLPQPQDPKTNPQGNLYAIERTVISKPTGIVAEPRNNRVIRFENARIKNPITSRNVGYKLIPSATQLLLAQEGSIQAKRAGFAKNHVWVTGYRDGELWAAGEYTNQSRSEVGGVTDMAARVGDVLADVEGTSGGNRCSPVVWAVFGLTHNPRVEDWPVMPVEIHQMMLKPVDFFTSNPAIDVPSSKNEASVLVGCCKPQENGTHSTNGTRGECNGPVNGTN